MTPQLAMGGTWGYEQSGREVTWAIAGRRAISWNARQRRLYFLDSPVTCALFEPAVCDCHIASGLQRNSSRVQRSSFPLYPGKHP